MHLVMLSGGSGRRLWPLSNDLYSKQYIKVIDQTLNDKNQLQTIRCSMLQRVYGQLKEAGLNRNLVIVANEPQVEIIESQLGKDVEVIIEPSRRDTMPAILLACAWLKSEKNMQQDDYIAVIPVDAYTEISFYQMLPQLENILKESKSQFGLMGARPTYPSEKYGYIMPESEDIGSQCFKVKGFKEKPDAKTAERLIVQGGMWNCGVVCFSLSTIDQYRKDYGLPLKYKDLVDVYHKIPAISFDYGILEKSHSLAALRYDGMWKDLGTWNTLTEEMMEQSVGNIRWDSTSSNSHAINMLDIPLVIMGAKDLIVVASHDGILVSDKAQSSYLKDHIKTLNVRPRFEEREWGNIKTIDAIDQVGSKSIITNRIKVFEEKHTTYHLHKKHDEIITVLSGNGILILEGEKVILSEGVSCHIEANCYHAVKALDTLKYIEVLLGETENDDVERLIYKWDDIQQFIAKND